MISSRNKVKNLIRKDLLEISKQSERKQIVLPLTYNRTLPNLRQIINKHWDILKINPELKEIFHVKPMIAFKRNKNIGEIIGGNTIKNNKVLKINKSRHNGKCTPCYSNSRALCCKQVQNTQTFQSFQAK